MSFEHAILNFLGLETYVEEGEQIFVAGKGAVSLILAFKELLETPDGMKFRDKAAAIIAATQKVGAEPPAAHTSPKPADQPQKAWVQVGYDPIWGPKYEWRVPK